MTHPLRKAPSVEAARGTRAHETRGPRLVALLAAAVLAALAVLLPTSAYAADDASIDHSEVQGDKLEMLVSVPGTEPVDLDSVSVTIGGADAEATAAPADTGEVVERTTVLAIDTSNSMRGERIEAAKAAALAYLDAVPDDVKVGIVTFDSSVELRQEPSTDRDESREVIEALDLRVDTQLYDGMRRAIETAGAGDGLRKVLLLSDGRDNTGAPLDPVIKDIRDSKVTVDVVSLELGRQGRQALERMATAGKGKVLEADPASLSATFAAEAEELARQVLVTASVPGTQTSDSASVKVSLDAGGAAHNASAFLAVRASAEEKAAEGLTVAKKEQPLLDLPEWAIYAGLGAIFVGIIGVVAALSGGKPERRLGVAEQIEVYGATAAHTKKPQKQQPAAEGLVEHAKQAAESVLASNTSLDAKIANRLDGAGMALKTSEWILMHAGVAVGAAVLGLLLGRGNPVYAILFLFFGALGPWVYLGMKRGKRLKAFNAGLADTLQLMSGSLSAGLSLAQSMDTVVREGSEPMTSEFKRVIAETRLGVELEDALDGITQRMDSKDFGWVVMAIRIQREVGGNLAELLLTVAATLREREYLRRHVRALSAEGRLSAWVLGGLPPVFLLYLVVSKPDYVNPMFTQPIGWLMLIGMAVLLAVGIFWMMKVAKVEV